MMLLSDGSPGSAPLNWATGGPLFTAGATSLDADGLPAYGETVTVISGDATLGGLAASGGLAGPTGVLDGDAQLGGLGAAGGMAGTVLAAYLTADGLPVWRIGSTTTALASDGEAVFGLPGSVVISGDAELGGLGASGGLSGGTPSELSGDAQLGGLAAGGGFSGGASSELSGDAQLGGLGASGGFSGGSPSELSGNATLGGLGAAGGLQGSLEPALAGLLVRTRVIPEWRASSMGTAKTFTDPLDVEESTTLIFDFTDELVAAGATIDSLDDVSIEVDLREGIDSDSAQILDGDPVLTSGNLVVTQEIRGRVAPVGYAVRCNITDTGGTSRTAVGILAVRRL